MAYMDDEEAWYVIWDEVLMSVGNNGQATIVNQCMEDVKQWYADAVEVTNADTSYSGFTEMIISASSRSAWMGTQEIWDHCYDQMAEQSAWHDGGERGEGTGKEF